MGNYSNDEKLMNEIREACLNSSNMREAFDKITININYCTFIKYAKKLNVFVSLKTKYNKIDLKDVLTNKRSIGAYDLRLKLIKEGYKEKKCEKCGLIHWKGKEISLELHHKDGNTRNNKLENLEILCPNCHAQTDNYRSKRKA